MRYDIPDENGETRRERNKRFGVDTPNITTPKGFSYLWAWYIEASSDAELNNIGMVFPIKYTSWKAWLEMENYKITDFEFRILKEIDRQYVKCFNKEISDMRERLSEKPNGRYSGTRDKGRQPRRKRSG